MADLTDEHIRLAAGPRCHPDGLHPDDCEGLREYRERLAKLRLAGSITTPAEPFVLPEWMVLEGEDAP